jgi:tetratricopeptide (TPR) repeat protein
VSLGVLLAAAGGLCTLPEPAPARDHEAAQAYVEVGDGELAAGSLDTAMVAYREALRLEPDSARAREGFLSACTRANPAEERARGRALMDAGERRAAIEVFERLRQGRTDRVAALLEGICLYEEGDDELARPLLVEARTAPDLAPRASYFLGLIELRDGSGSDAVAHFEAASAEKGLLAERAELLRNIAYHSGRGVLALSIESGYDSNVNYTPNGLPASADGAGATGLVFALRPLGVSGPFLRAYGYYRQQFQATDRDFGNFGGQAGWRAGRGDRYLFADYAFDASLLGGSPFLYAHRLRGGGRWQIRRVGLTAVYGARFGSYQTIDSAPYSGILQTVDADISIRFWLGSVVVLGYHAGRDAANAPEAASWEHGPRAAVRFVLLPTLSVSADAAWLWLPFDAPAPGSSVARSDRILYLAAAVEKDFANRFTLRLSLGDRIARSNLSAYSYSRITATLALSYTLGLF